MISILANHQQDGTIPVLNGVITPIINGLRFFFLRLFHSELNGVISPYFLLFFCAQLGSWGEGQFPSVGSMKNRAGPKRPAFYIPFQNFTRRF